LSQAQAPGKVILFGEHAVVYGRPAIAVPVRAVRATVTVQDVDRPGLIIYATDIGCTIDCAAAPADEPLSLTVRNTLAQIGVDPAAMGLRLTISSSIPVASGMGSGAAVATALCRALSAHLAHLLDAAAISAIVYETEKVYHGTPSGIDNSVVAFERPVYFERGKPIVTLSVRGGGPNDGDVHLAIADTGVPSLTKAAVADVRAAWQREPERYEALFDQIGTVARAARAAIEEGCLRDLGPLMDENQRLLRQLDVSSPELEALIAAARREGALGAKLSGGGRGGNAIALIEARDGERIARALRAAGAKNVILTRVG
jgi:mevalonate kinase